MVRSLVVSFAVIICLPDLAWSNSATFSCSFVESCIRDEGCSLTDLKIDYVINLQTGDAQAMGNLGNVSVMPLVGDELISFVQPLDSGAVQATTIFPDGSAVHSRHTYILDTSFPQQLFGTCETSS